MPQPDAIELYKFERGAVGWYYTSSAAPVEHDGNTYVPEAITRGEDEQGQEINRAELEVVVPRGNEVAAQFVGYAPEAVMQLTVYRKRDDVTAVTWRGRVMGSRRAGNRALLQCEPIFTSLRRPGLVHRYGINCRHFVYDAGCGLDAENFKVTMQVGDISGLNISAQDLGDKEDGYYQAGYVRAPDGEVRMILAHVGETMTITAPIPGLQVLDQIEVYPGCPHTLAACFAKFDNAENFGGFPFIPGVNPFGHSIV